MSKKQKRDFIKKETETLKKKTIKDNLSSNI